MAANAQQRPNTSELLKKNGNEADETFQSDAGGNRY